MEDREAVSGEDMYLHLREEIGKRRWRERRSEGLHDLYCRWSIEGGRVARTGDRNSETCCVGKPALTVIWNPEKLTVMLLVRSLDVCLLISTNLNSSPY